MWRAESHSSLVRSPLVVAAAAPLRSALPQIPPLVVAPPALHRRRLSNHVSYLSACVPALSLSRRGFSSVSSELASPRWQTPARAVTAEALDLFSSRGRRTPHWAGPASVCGLCELPSLKWLDLGCDRETLEC